jgi:nucleotidyltransferase substrate binding protein (TIGR01987 family)
MTPSEKTLAVHAQFKKALFRLKDALAQPKNEFMRDATIQRFEFTFDLSWKLLKTILKDEKGVLCHSPKDCFRQAYKSKLIAYEKAWLEMTDMRNLTSHTYNEDTAEEIYSALPKLIESFESLVD